MNDILSSVAIALSLTTRLREIGNNIEDAEFKNLLADLSLELADAKLKISDLVSENMELKDKLHSLTSDTEKLCPKCNQRGFYFDGEVYWDRVSRFPYCPRCYGEDKRIQMVVMDTGTNGALDGYCCLTCGLKHVDLP